MRNTLPASSIIASLIVGTFSINIVNVRGDHIEEDQTIAQVRRVLDSGRTRTLRVKPIGGSLLSSFSYGEIAASAPYELMNAEDGMISGQAEKGSSTLMSKSGKSGKAAKDPICKMPFFKTTPECSVCEDQKFYYYDTGSGEGFCDRGFALVEELYIRTGFGPTDLTGYDSGASCCKANSCFETDPSYDFCLCFGDIPPPYCCDEAVFYVGKPPDCPSDLCPDTVL